MKNTLKNFTLFQSILLLISVISYTICAIISWSLDGWIAWASCMTFVIYLIYNANRNYISFVWIIISYLIYIYFNIKEFYFGEFTLSVIAIIINLIALFSWKKHTTNNQLQINKLGHWEIIISFLGMITLSTICYVILKLLNSNLVILNALSISCVMLEYYFTFRRTTLKYVAGIMSVIIYILLWTFAITSIKDYAFMLVVNGYLNIIWYVDGIIEWHKISKQQK